MLRKNVLQLIFHTIITKKYTFSRKGLLTAGSLPFTSFIYSGRKLGIYKNNVIAM